MKRVRIDKPKVLASRTRLEVLALDPRDPDVLRAKAAIAERRDVPGSDWERRRER